MSEPVLKHFRVLTRSWINNAIHQGGDIVAIKIDPDTGLPPAHHAGTLGPHLEEIPDYEPKHTEAQQKAADAQAALHEESLAKQAEREAAEAKPTDEPEFAMPPPPNLPTEQPQDNT